jgi:hypothetical protein
MIPVRILPQKSVIDDGFLDLIGREFSTHAQGLSEWLKNAVDATLAAGFTSRRETIVLRFTDGDVRVPPVFECVDFVGMSLDAIETTFKPWGKWSRDGGGFGRYGGYGIGGKFYMRQMFRCSYLMTYAKGFLNLFGFDTDHAYGYAEGYTNRRVEPLIALERADIGRLAEIVGMKRAVMSGKRGFSVVRGIGPEGMDRTIDVERLCEQLGNHPQARRLLKVHRVGVMHNDIMTREPLKPQPIPRRSGFGRPWIRSVPRNLTRPEGSEAGGIHLSGDSRSPGTLRLSLSSQPLVQKGKMASLNRIDFLNKGRVVASYRIDELGVEGPHSDSIFGECVFSRMGPLQRRLFSKTRDKLVDSPEARALLQWVGLQVSLFSRTVIQGALQTGVGDGLHTADR